MERINKDFSKILSDDELQATALQIDAAVSEIIEIGKEREKIYGNRAEIMKRIKELTTEIQLAESDAIMNIQGSGKDAFGVIDGRKIFLTNDTARDAYRREASRKERTELGKLEGQAEYINQEYYRLTDHYNEKVEVLHGLQAKAKLQSAYLSYLGC